MPFTLLNSRNDRDVEHLLPLLEKLVLHEQAFENLEPEMAVAAEWVLNRFREPHRFAEAREALRFRMRSQSLKGFNSHSLFSDF